MRDETMCSAASVIRARVPEARERAPTALVISDAWISLVDFR